MLRHFLPTISLNPLSSEKNYHVAYYDHFYVLLSEFRQNGQNARHTIQQVRKKKQTLIKKS